MFREKPPRYVMMEVHPSAMRKYRSNPEGFYNEIRALGYWLIAVDGQEIKEEAWEGLVKQQGRVFDTLWVRTEPPAEGKFDWGLDYYSGMMGDYSTFTETPGGDTAVVVDTGAQDGVEAAVEAAEVVSVEQELIEELNMGQQTEP